MANLEGKHRIMRDYLFRVWNSVDDALQLTRATGPRKQREQVRNPQAVARRMVSFCEATQYTPSQMQIVHDTLESAHKAVIEAMALVVIAGLIEPSVGLSYVPRVALQMRTPLDVTKATLLGLEQAGKIELRADVTQNILHVSRSDQAMAPEAQDGSSLLWTRLLTRVPGL